MKKLFYALLTVLSSFGLYAQDTIGVSSLPQPGFTYIVSNDTVHNYVIPAASLGHQTWDYSFLSESYVKVPTYDSTIKTPYASFVSTSNLYTYGPAILYSGLYGSAPVNGSNNGYMFWKTDSTGFWIEGFRGDSGPYGGKIIYVQPHELVMPLPGILQKTTHSQSQWQINVDANPNDVDTVYRSRITKDFTYDAWGELSTPIAHYTKVLRLHEYSIKVDSVFSILHGTTLISIEVLRDTTHTYYYLDKDSDYPVLTTYARANNQVKFTEYYKMKTNSPLAVDKNRTEGGLKIYPNPCENRLYYHTEVPHSTFIILNLEGKMIQEFELTASSGHLEIQDILPGVYMGLHKDLKGNILSFEKIIKY